MARSIPVNETINDLSERQRRIYDFLKSHSVSVLSTANKQAVPHGVVIYYNITPDFEITFVTKAKTRKYINLKENNRLMMTVFEPRAQTICQIYGFSKTVQDPDRSQKAIASIMKKSMHKSEAGVMPISKIEAGDYMVLEVIPEIIKFSVYARPKPLSNEEIFESLAWYELDASELPQR